LDINLELKKYIKWVCKGAKDALKWAFKVATGSTKLTLQNRASSVNYYYCEALKTKEMPPQGAKPMLTMKQIEYFDKHKIYLGYIRNFDGFIEAGF